MKVQLQVTSAPATNLPFDDSPTSWMGEGNCRNYPPATFFPSDGVGVDRARAICKGCPVSNTCLEYALAERIDHGVLGASDNLVVGVNRSAAFSRLGRCRLPVSTECQPSS
jgi:WhiB family redox-sensing transcriptional regulator